MQLFIVEIHKSVDLSRLLAAAGLNDQKLDILSVGLQLFIVEIHNGKIHMYFVTPVLYQITCITSNMDLQDTDTNV